MKKVIMLALIVGLIFVVATPCFASGTAEEIGKEVLKQQIKKQVSSVLNNATTGKNSNSKDRNAKNGYSANQKDSFHKRMLGDTTRRKENQKNALIVGFEAEFAPYTFVASDGSYDGFDLACAKELCRRLGWKFEAMPIDWNAKDSELKAGTVNCIWSGFSINGRENDYEWSVPYIENKMVMVVKSHSPYRRLADLKGKKVAVLDGSSALNAINDKQAFKKSLKKLIVVVNYENAFDYLTKGSVDAVAVDLAHANNFVTKSKGKFSIMPEVLAKEQYAVAFLKGDVALKNAVNKELQKMAYDGTIKKIAANYVKQGLILDSICIGRSSRRR